MTKRTILVVEDNPLTLKMLRLTLESAGYAVLAASDGRSAIAAARAALPDLVVQDLVLPDMDGFTLLRELRTLPGGLERPVLALSGLLNRLEDPRTLDEGFTALLVKPIEPSRLIESIRTFLPDDSETIVPVGEGRRLLVVDDDAVQLKLTRLHFAQLGFDVAAAASAADGLRTARANPPELILSDVFMPDRDGFQFCVDVRSDPVLAQVPVVLLSAQAAGAAEHDMARRVGANALVLRTPDFAPALTALLEALAMGAAASADRPDVRLQLKHARLTIQQLERQAAAASGLARRCAFQAAQLSLLSGVADALTGHADIDLALREVLAGTLDAAGISKGALFLRNSAGTLRLQHDVGFSEAERARLPDFFGRFAWFSDMIERGAAVALPSAAVPADTSQAILDGAHVTSAEIVPLMSRARGVGAMVIGASRVDVTTNDLVAFARTIGNQVVNSMALTDVVGQLAVSDARYRALLKNASDAIATLTPDGVFRRANPRWEEILGRSETEMIGHRLDQFVAPDLEGANVRLCRELLAGEGGGTPLLPIVRGDESIAWIEFSASRMEIGGDTVVFAIGRDITEQRRLEDQLDQAQKLEAIGQLAGGVAHDFNNVLTSILGFCGLLQEEIDPQSPQHADLVEIQKAGERAAALTRQLLAFSRRQILQPKILDVNALVRNVEQMLRRLIFEHIEMTLSLQSNGGLIRIDESQFEQILVNLAVNARDAMPSGGRLTIATDDVTAEEVAAAQGVEIAPCGYIALTISDTGTGMDAATRRRIFEPFFTTKGVGKGTGLGLATVYGIVRQSGGYVSVASDIGKGSRFTIYLPRVENRADLPTLATAEFRQPRGSETVLLVEDDEAVRRLARLTLQRNGYHVLEAGNPREAVGIASEYAQPIHLLLSDVIMPESTGTPLIERLTLERPTLRVLYMSGSDGAIVYEGLLDAGAPFLPKPFVPDTLARKVREVLDARPS